MTELPGNWLIDIENKIYILLIKIIIRKHSLFSFCRQKEFIKIVHIILIAKISSLVFLTSIIQSIIFQHPSRCLCVLFFTFTICQVIKVEKIFVMVFNVLYDAREFTNSGNIRFLHETASFMPFCVLHKQKTHQTDFLFSSCPTIAFLSGD